MRVAIFLLFICCVPGVFAQDFSFKKLDLEGQPQGSRGVSIADLDADGLLDIVVANQVDSTLMLGNTILFNNGNKFGRIPIAENKVQAWSESVHTIDVDNDRDLDIFFTTQFGVPNLLYENNGEGNFSASNAGDLTSDLTNSPGACWCDYDLDGDMDVFVVNRDGEDDNLYINMGSGKFKKAASGPWINNNGDGRACLWGDLNGDGFPDLYVANFVVKNNGKFTGKHRNYLYWNSPKGEFIEQTEGDLVEELNASYGVSFVDYDSDMDLDMYVTNVSISDENALYQNSGSGVFKKITENGITYEVRRPSKGQTWGDFNNDGRQDLYVANGTEGYPEIQNFLFAGHPDHAFKRMYNSLPAIEGHISAGTASGDLNRDGYLDLYVCNWGGEAEPNDCYINQKQGDNWVVFQLSAIASNSYGIGSWVKLTASNGTVQTRYLVRETGYGSENAPEIHFGLASQEIAKVEFIWPNGTKQKATNLVSNQIYKVIEGKEIKQVGK
ncbi:CRTAC1 family protein [Flagellimonas sp. S3867]|uniref:CRTAC1 family protein n=1 Tax=Flagellimonas sp. S3867 TaxID=2768063 RepID=UPI00168A1CD6|nr:CRTAC1 family protein [Flagellimonas sp. S3867]